MVLKIYGNTLATCTRRVLTIVNELNVPYELVTVGFTGDTKTPEWLAVQPFGQMPYIDDDGFKLFESRAICRYIALKYGGVEAGIIPSPADVEKTALFDQAASIEVCNFDPSASGLGHELVLKPMFGQKTDDEKAEGYKKTLAAKLAAYDVLLGRTKFLGGDELTIVDLFHLPYGWMIATQNADLFASDKLPNVARWWKDVTARASWKKVAEA